MRKILLVLSVLLSFNVVATNADEKIIIQDIMRQQESAWNEGNLESFMQAYWQSEQLKFVGKNGIKYGWQATLDNYKKTYHDKAAMGELKFDILSVEVQSDSAFVLGKWSLKRKTDNPSGFYTLLWKKIDGKWKIVIDHSS
ncbi:YybH family protein [Aliikangiella coralliicola]|uniref:DUF4440 domain-containing protein n=1 Tax=Aliikangiella coralliicola TaxID=2592383 RepID=A0A545UFA2_9GAMM|nr:DUF4440 domain-containing protein [Aliikangiella coralliicola]TQV88144.1 DUF4440 domain-containing protein [Aliikangiella coralliicola]